MPMSGVWEKRLGIYVGVQGLAPVAGQPSPEALPCGTVQESRGAISEKDRRERGPQRPLRPGVHSSSPEGPYIPGTGTSLSRR